MTVLNEFLFAVAWRIEKFTEGADSFDSAPLDIVANRYIIGIFLDYTLNLQAVYTRQNEIQTYWASSLEDTALSQLLSVEKRNLSRRFVKHHICRFQGDAVFVETSASIPFSLTREPTQLTECSCESLTQFNIDCFPPSKHYAF